MLSLFLALVQAAPTPPPLAPGRRSLAPEGLPAARRSSAAVTNGAAVDLTQAVRDATDGCRAATPAPGITVCGGERGEPGRYRLPLRDEDRGFDPLGSVDSVSRERHRLLDADGFGQDLTRGSCSSVGASGWTGCTIKAWREADQQKGW